MDASSLRRNSNKIRDAYWNIKNIGIITKIEYRANLLNRMRWAPEQAIAHQLNRLHVFQQLLYLLLLKRVLGVSVPAARHDFDTRKR